MIVMLTTALFILIPATSPAAARADATQTNPSLGVWHGLANRHHVTAVAIDPQADVVWTGTTGGAVRWDRRTGTYTGYTPPDGLPLGGVQAIAIDRDGNTWFGTAGGGVGVLEPAGRWTRIDPSMDGLPSASISAIAVDRDGGLWFAAADAGAAHRAADGTWTRYRVGQGLTSNEVQSLAIDPAGDKWLGTAEGVSRIGTDGRVTKFTTGNAGLIGDNIRAVAADAAGRVWFGTYDGLSRRNADGAWESFLEGQAVLAVAIGQDGAAWAGTAGEGVYRIADGVVVNMTASGELPHDYVYAIATDAQGRVYAGTEEGLARRGPDDAWTTLRTADPPLDAHVTAVLPEPGGGTWFGTLAGVGYQAADGEWTIHTPASTNGGMPSNNVNALALDRAGHLWVGTANGVGERSPDGTWTRYTSMSTGGGLAHNYVNAIVMAEDGALWFATNTGGASRRAPDGTWTTATRDSTGGGLPDDRVYAAAIDGEGNLWFGTLGGVGRRAPDGAWTTYTTASTSGGLPNDRVGAIYADRKGNHWFGTLAGVARLAPDGTWTVFSVASTGGGLPEDEARVITEDAAGNLWFGTPAGAVRLADGTWTTYTTADGLADDRVLAIAATADAGLWIGAYGGGSRLIPRRPGLTCADALPITLDGVVAARLEPGAERHVYRISIDGAFSRAELNVPDLDDRVDATLVRTCDPADSGELPLSGARWERGENRLAWDILSRTGPYFLMLRPKSGVDLAQPIPYRLRLGLIPAADADWRPPVGDRSPLGEGLDDDGLDIDASPRMLILTHAPRIRELYGLGENDPELVAWLERLDRLAARPELRGVVVRDIQHETSREVEAEYDAWLSNPTLAQADVVAWDLSRWVWEQKARWPGLRYVVLAGDSRVIPHARMTLAPRAEHWDRDWMPDWRDFDWRLEADYSRAAGFDRQGPLGTGMQSEQTLSDDPYGWPRKLPGISADAVLPQPELAIGRLVERPSDMTAVIDAYLANEGMLQISDSFVTGSGPGVEAARAVGEALGAFGPGSGQRHRLVGDTWTSVDLLPFVMDGPFSFNFFAIPTWHDALVAANGDAVGSRNIGTGLGGSGAIGPKGALVIATGSHAGLNVPAGADVRRDDLPEAWARRGATVVASTGWTYGTELPGVAGWQTALGTELTRVLLQGRGMAIGDALVEAKRAYLGHYPGAAIHNKTVAGTLLYGLPMLRVVPPGAGLPQTGPAGGEPAAGMLAQARGKELVRADTPQFVWLRAGQRYTFPADKLRRHPEAAPGYWTFGGQAPAVEAGQYVQPAARLAMFSAALGDKRATPIGDLVSLLGVIVLQATYREVPAAAPPAARPLGLGLPLLGSGRAGGRLDMDSDPYAWYPAWPVTPRGLFDPRTLGEPPGLLFGHAAHPLPFVLGQYQPRTGAERLIESAVLDEYYAPPRNPFLPLKNADKRILEPVEIRAEPGGTFLRFRCEGLLRMVATYTTSESPRPGSGVWESVEMVPSPDDNPHFNLWEGRIPPGTSAVIQAVSTYGTVVVETNGGRLWPCAACPDEGVVYLPAVGWPR